MIRMTDSKSVAEALHARYEPIRAVTLIGRTMLKALFAGRSSDVVFWALVHAHYRGDDLSDNTQEQLAVFRDFIIPDPTDIN